MLKGYRTIIFNVLMTALMILSTTGVIGSEDVPGSGEINAFLDSLDVVIAGVWGIGNLIFRKITNTAIGESEPEKVLVPVDTVDPAVFE